MSSDATRKVVLEGLVEARQIIRAHLADQNRSDVYQPWATTLIRLDHAIAYLDAPALLSRPDSAPWPPRDVLGCLLDAADHLLNHHDCDHQGYEELCAARDAGRQWLAIER
jgi:hypothetical protein